MAKSEFVIGYGETQETAPGVWVDVITEHRYFGDLITNSRHILESEQVNPDISLGNSASIVADAYANGHIFAIKYIKWAGSYWTVSDVTVERPRLILRIGGIYNGPKGTAPESP